jgi:hypothetical protein
MRATYKLVLSLAVTVGFLVALAAPSLAGPVQYTATLKAGFADSYHGSISNNGLPVCGQDTRVFFIFNHPVFGPIPLPTVLGKHETGTMYAQGYASTGGGTHATVMFPAKQALASTTGTNIAGLANVGNGGAFARVRATCQVILSAFQNPRFRTRNQFAGGDWPGEAGTVGQNQGMDFGGAGVPGSIDLPIPFFTGRGKQHITKGPLNFGGGVPAVTTGPVIYSSFVSSMDRGLGNGVALGINTAIVTPTALSNNKTLKTFGKVEYLAGYLPTGPNKAGGDTGTHRPLTSAQALPTGMQTTYTNFFAYRTKGGSTVAQHGFIKTAGGTVGHTNGAGCAGVLCLNTPAQIRIALQQLTTGIVLHTDSVGDYLTDRGTTGFDQTGLAGSNGTTRSLSLVAPFSATIRMVGGFGLGVFVPELGFGGIGNNTYAFQPAPVPEPASMLALGFGTMALFGLHRIRRK